MLTYPIGTLNPKITGIPSGSLLGEWLFSGNANDTSGNGYNGTVNGATLTNDRHSSANSAYNFVGTSDDYIQVDSISITGSISISCWVRWVSGNNVGVMGKYSFAGNNQGDFNIALFNNEVYFRINNISYNVLSSVGNMNNSVWRHVVAIFDGSQLKLVVDDSNVNTTPAVVTLDNLYNRIRFGQYFSSTGNSMTGDLDDIRIYNRVLSASEITALYNE